MITVQVAFNTLTAQNGSVLNQFLNETDIQKQINILFAVNDDKESMRMIDEAVRREPSNPRYHYIRGILNNSRQKYSRALDDFSKAIDMDPGQSLLYRCYLGRGVSYMNLMEYDQALADLNTSIEKNDTVAVAYYSRGRVNYELKDYEASVKDYLRILEFSEGNGTLYFNLGMAYYRLDEKDNACRSLNKACTLGNTNACRMSLMECAKAIPTP
jgi:tetratricopeptide (TPR) repeat protein